jgi:hypothetical protein
MNCLVIKKSNRVPRIKEKKTGAVIAIYCCGIVIKQGGMFMKFAGKMCVYLLIACMSFATLSGCQKKTTNGPEGHGTPKVKETKPGPPPIIMKGSGLRFEAIGTLGNENVVKDRGS